jgi:hypothetical protein
MATLVRESRACGILAQTDWYRLGPSARTLASSRLDVCRRLRSLPRGETLHISEDDLNPSIPDVPQNPLKFCAPTPEGEDRFFHRGAPPNTYPKRLWNLYRNAKVFSSGLL